MPPKNSGHVELNIDLTAKEIDIDLNEKKIDPAQIIKKSDVVIAEVSYPATGEGIELGWANGQKVADKPGKSRHSTEMPVCHSRSNGQPNGRPLASPSKAPGKITPQPAAPTISPVKSSKTFLAKSRR